MLDDFMKCLLGIAGSLCVHLIVLCLAALLLYDSPVGLTWLWVAVPAALAVSVFLPAGILASRRRKRRKKKWGSS